MLMTIICAILGVTLSIVVTATNNLYNGISDIWIPICLFFAFTIASAATMILIVLILTLFVDVKKPVKKPNKVWFAIYNFINSFLVAWAGINLKVKENEKLGKGPYLFVINHRSNFDTMIVSVLYRKYKPIMISKPGNFKIPVAGPAIHEAGFLCMPRDDAKGALNVVNEAVNYLEEGKYSIGLCPEGTRNKNGRELLPFKNGCLKIALRSKTPIVVLCVDGTEKIHKNFPFKRTKVYFDLIKVISPEEYEGKNTQQLGAEIAELMLKTINSHQKIEDDVLTDESGKKVA